MQKLRFYLNQSLDELMAEQFIDDSSGGVDFGKRIIEIHPKLKLVKHLGSDDQKREIIHRYFNNYYTKNQKDIKQNTATIKNAWHTKEKKYITVTKKFFNGFPFPKGKYIAYPSIIDCNPRFLDSKTFQFFYKKSTADAIHTIAHELLHFIFFDFAEKKFKKETKNLSQNQLWDVSEIFNVMVLKSPKYKKIVNRKFVIPYPEHVKCIKKLTSKYDIDPKNAKELIKNIVNII